MFLVYLQSGGGEGNGSDGVNVVFNGGDGSAVTAER